MSYAGCYDGPLGDSWNFSCAIIVEHNSATNNVIEGYFNVILKVL